jgi:hypothetical protein
MKENPMPHLAPPSTPAAVISVESAPAAAPRRIRRVVLYGVAGLAALAFRWWFRLFRAVA